MDLRERREVKSDFSIRHPWELARLHIVTRLLKAHAGETPQQVLDIGCGDAFVVGQLSRRFSSTRFTAVDTALDESLVESLSQSFPRGNVTFYQTLEDAESKAGEISADVVLLLDVIEHVEDDIGLLKRLRQSALTSEKTLFLITVPAWQRLHSQHDVFLGHFRRYDSGVLAQHLTEAGLHVEQTGYFFISLLLLRSLAVARERWNKNKPETAIGLAAWRRGPFVTELVRRLLIFDFTCTRLLRRLGIRLPGLSQYALCKPLVS
jgi:hypothetical protein